MMNTDPLSSNASSYQKSLIAKERFYNIFMQLPAMLCVLKGPDFIFELANEPYRNLVGNRNIIGKPLKEALPEIEGQGFIEKMNEVYKTGEPYIGKEIPVLLERGDDKKLETVYLNFTYQALLDNNGNTEGVLVFAYDVTEQVISRDKFRESELKYRNLIHGLPFALYTCDANGYIRLYNEAAVKLWGSRPGIGKDMWYASWKIYSPSGELLPVTEVPLAFGAKKNNENKEIIVQRPDGTSSHVIPYSQPVYDKDGKLTVTINTLVDITEKVNASRQLEEAAEMVERLYMNAPAFICILKGPEFIYELVNPEYQKLYGKRKLLGRKVFDALPELEGQGIRDKLNEVYKTGKSYVVTEVLLYLARDEDREPEPTYLNYSYQPIYNAAKEINGILVFGYEVTAQVMARKKSEENLKIILESLPQITSASSPNGKDIFFNKYFFDYSGITKEEASKNGWNSILHPSEVEDVLAHWDDCIRSGEDFYKILRLRRKRDGMYRWHIAHLTSLKDEKGEVTQWIGSATDIHEQKMKEEKKDEFMSIASHEMKTPLTTAKAYLQLLELSLDKDNKKANFYIDKAIHSVDRLMELISELLDVNKIQYGKLNLNESFFDFNEMVNEAVDAVQYNSAKHTIVKNGHIEGKVKGDKDRLQQVVINLLSNAVKYSPDSQEVNISYSEQKNEIQLSVKDTGIGISKDDLGKIFNRYFRVEGQDIHFQGLGIGLFISMEIIKRHNGILWAESEPGKGSIFYFILPDIKN